VALAWRGQAGRRPVTTTQIGQEACCIVCPPPPSRLRGAFAPPPVPARAHECRKRVYACGAVWR